MTKQTTEDWLASLAAKQPTPGGGAVAALLAATAAALLGMVSIYTTGPKWPTQSDNMKKLSDKLDVLRRSGLTLMAKDEEAFAKVGAAYQLIHETAHQKAVRKDAIEQALIGAAEPPTQVIQLSVDLLAIARELAKSGNPNVISDVSVAASSIRAALDAAIVNIEVNQQFIKRSDAKNKLQSIIEQAKDASLQTEQVVSQVRERIKKL